MASVESMDGPLGAIVCCGCPTFCGRLVRVAWKVAPGSKPAGTVTWKRPLSAGDLHEGGKERSAGRLASCAGRRGREAMALLELRAWARLARAGDHTAATRSGCDLIHSCIPPQ